MAKLVTRLISDEDDVLEIIPFKERFKIYVKSVFINWLIVIKWFFKSAQTSFDHKYGSIPRNNYYYKKLQLLNGNGLLGNKKSITSSSMHDNQKPPRCLMDSTLGSHSNVKLKKTKLHYLESGPSNAPVVLLLHGFPDCWFSWRFQIPELSKHFRVIALDLKGFNDSDKPSSRREYTPKVICEELKVFLETLNVEQMILMGHDLGGIIGWTFAYYYPKMVEKFVCVSAPHPNHYWKKTKKDKAAPIDHSWVQFVQSPIIPEMELKRTSEIFLSKFYPHLANKGTFDVVKDNGLPISHDAIDAYKYIFKRKKDWSGPLNYYRNFPFYRVRNAGGRLKCPTLIVSGNEDKTFKLETIVKSSEYCVTSLIKIIEDVGHFPHQESPLEFNEIIMTYLVGDRPPDEEKIPISPPRSLVGRMFSFAQQKATNGYH